ncbi:unnamed protein product [Vitrella brassicaformis CCMP3155]|uniref:Uncharacterized protein n=2 Tax=Vitrella brassicaformis TaxID=1169539 RepID=A0A0G4H862_VITBC|nr:unnamed protein product [Vitrella brassicaformis CCMP3155]|eukprot:CEM40087.1 unnamed protein product [Vitrella brassicaformis CCMP3155]
MSRLGLEDVLSFDIDDLEGVFKVLYALRQGDDEWRAIGRTIRVASVCQLTTDSPLPLRLSPDSLPTATAFDKLPLAMVLYGLVGHLLECNGSRLTLHHDDNGACSIYDEAFDVVRLGDLPPWHGYAEAYQMTDPVVRCRKRQRKDIFYPSFSLSLVHLLAEWSRKAAGKRLKPICSVGRPDRRFPEAPCSYKQLLECRLPDRRIRRLMTEGISGVEGIAGECRFEMTDAHQHPYCATSLAYQRTSIYRRILVLSDSRANKVIIVHLEVKHSQLFLFTTEPPAAEAAQPMTVRFPVSMRLLRPVLRRFDLEAEVVQPGLVIIDDDEEDV